MSKTNYQNQHRDTIRNEAILNTDEDVDIDFNEESLGTICVDSDLPLHKQFVTDGRED